MPHEKPHAEWFERLFIKPLRYVRSIATWEAEGLCDALERWSRERDDEEGAKP